MTETNGNVSTQGVLHGLASPGFTPQTFFSFLILQMLVLLIWWPKGGLFDRIDAAAEPVTLAAVVIFTGVALAWYALQLSADELTDPHNRCSALRLQNNFSAMKFFMQYSRAHALQLGYLMLLCTPAIIVAHAISSVPFTQLLWIGGVTAVHTTFYRLLGTWIHLHWPGRNLLATILSRTMLVAIYLCTIILLPDLNPINISFQLTQPHPSESPTKSGLLLIITFAALCVCVSMGLWHQLSKRNDSRSTEPEVGI